MLATYYLYRYIGIIIVDEDDEDEEEEEEEEEEEGEDGHDDEDDDGIDVADLTWIPIPFTTKLVEQPRYARDSLQQKLFVEVFNDPKASKELQGGHNPPISATPFGAGADGVAWMDAAHTDFGNNSWSLKAGIRSLRGDSRPRGKTWQADHLAKLVQAGLHRGATSGVATNRVRSPFPPPRRLQPHFVFSSSARRY